MSWSIHSQSIVSCWSDDFPNSSRTEKMYHNFIIKMDFTREFQNVFDQTQTGRFQGKSHSIQSPSMNPGHVNVPSVLLVNICFEDFLI